MTQGERDAKTLITVVMAICGLLSLLPTIERVLFPHEPLTVEDYERIREKMRIMEESWDD
jgi:hypothetical protein